MPFTINTGSLDGLSAALHAVRDEVSATRALVDDVVAGTSCEQSAGA
jgi:hypothetical protein